MSGCEDGANVHM